jgi:phage FluMu gp28-like protein
MAKKTGPASAGIGSRNRKDGRRQVLLYIKPEVTKALKKAALDEERNAYEIAEDAIVDYLKRKRKPIM